VKAKIEIKCLKKINKRLTLMCELRKVKEMELEREGVATWS